MPRVQVAALLALVAACGGRGEDAAGPAPQPAVSIEAFSVDAEVVTEGDPVTLAWQFRGGRGAITELVVGDGYAFLGGWLVGDAAGAARILPAAGTTQWWLTVTDAEEKSVQRSVSILAHPRPEIRDFTAWPARVARGEHAWLAPIWEQRPGLTAEVDHGVGPVSRAIVEVGPLLETTTFTLTIRNALGREVRAEATVVADPPP